MFVFTDVGGGGGGEESYTSPRTSILGRSEDLNDWRCQRKMSENRTVRSISPKKRFFSSLLKREGLMGFWLKGCCVSAQEEFAISYALLQIPNFLDQRKKQTKFKGTGPPPSLSFPNKGLVFDPRKVLQKKPICLRNRVGRHPTSPPPPTAANLAPVM